MTKETKHAAEDDSYRYDWKNKEEKDNKDDNKDNYTGVAFLWLCVWYGVLLGWIDWCSVAHDFPYLTNVYFSRFWHKKSPPLEEEILK